MSGASKKVAQASRVVATRQASLITDVSPRHSTSVGRPAEDHRGDVAAPARKSRTELPNDFAALSVLLPRVVVATVGVIVAFAIVRGGNLSNRYGVNCGELCVRHKPWDKAMFIAAVVFAGLLAVYFLRRRPTRAAHVAVSICAVGGLLVGIARIERSGQRVQFGAPALPRFIWEGFGVPVAIAAVLLAVVLWRGLERIETSRTLRVVLTAAIGLVAFIDLASLVRTLSNFFEPNDNQYVLNEVLAPAAGKVPGATFVPQYVNLYGWLLVPLRHFMSPRGLAQSAMILLSVLGLLSVVLAVTIAYRAMSSPSFWFAAGVIVPLTCVTVMHGATPWSSIGSALQELPIRVFPAMLLSFLGLEELSRRRAGSVRTWRLPALGVLAGLIAWNCQDFGVAIVIAYSALLVVALPAAKLRKSLALWVAGVFGGLALYPLVTVLAGTPIRLDQIALFTRAYGSGFGADLVQVPGPVLVVLPLILSSVAVGWCLLWRQRRRVATGDAPNDRTVLTLALVGTWALGGFVYYLNRSYASGQLQILLMPCGVCAVALVSLARDARSRVARSSPDHRALTRRMSFALLPAALIASLGFASMLQSPNPVRVFKDLADPPAGYGFAPRVTSLSTIHSVEAYVGTQGGSLGYFGNNGNYIHLVTGLPDLLLYDDPGMLTTSPILLRAGCAYLVDHETTWIVVSANADSGNGPDICGSYFPVDVAGLPPRTLFLRAT